jgi:hypothetical protein
MAITYTPATNFGAKDTLPTNDPGKVIKGAEFTTEFNAIQTAFGFAAPAASPALTGTVSLNGTGVDAILDEDNMASDSDTALATQQSIKAYVDSQTTDFTSIATDVEPTTDNNNDLGSASKRWQDLYLSGGIYIGGTTSANYLEDYEEGTFSPTLLAGMTGTIGSITATYTKVGRQVHVRLIVDGASLAVSSACTFRSLPFTIYDTSGFGLDFVAVSGNAWKNSPTVNQWAIGASLTGTADFNFGVLTSCDKVYGAGTYETT